MLLISSDKSDVSTIDVLDWIYYLCPSHQVLRLNDEVKIKKMSYTVNSHHEHLYLETFDEKILDSSKIKTYWYRRGDIGFLELKNNINSRDEFLTSANFNLYLKGEIRDIINGINNHISSNGINKPSDNNINKIQILGCAASAGLQIPDTIITNNVLEFQSFISRHDKIITKSISIGDFWIKFDYNVKANISANTRLINREEASKIIETFKDLFPLPSLFQQYIEKKYELRVFYLNNTFYPMAIFSQANEKTRIDFRHYDRSNPNRCVPYKLPKEVEEKLKLFIKKSNVNCGSMDMIITPSNEFVFLELNPIGQFQWLSRNCNYDIERKIASYLIEGENE